MINVDVEFKLLSDDFYLQWEHIFWWQLKFDMVIIMQEELKRLGVEKQ